MCADYLQKHYSQKRYKEIVLRQPEATLHDLNLPEDVKVCGVAGSAPPVSQEHTRMSSLLSDL